MYDTILVPIDGSEGVRRAAEHAAAIAERFGSTVHLLYVADTTHVNVSAQSLDLKTVREAMREKGQEATAAAAELVERAGVTATTAVESGSTPKTILEYADDHDVDLVVMGTHGSKGLERWLIGSVAERVVRDAEMPVMTVHLGERDEE
jgi:nucleotide-binding universal stress UspA family protein